MFTFEMPTKLYAGNMPELYNDFVRFAKGSGKALIVTGKSSGQNGSLEDARAMLKQCGVSCVVFDEVEENPSFETVEKAAALAVAEGAGCVVGIGGGSPMDAAKAVCVLAANPGKTAADLFEPEALPRLPLALVPTTAGTGSETTPFSILTDHAAETKKSMAQLVFADAAFLDARYTAGLPRHITNSTATDTLAHLIESYLSAFAAPFSEALCESGLRRFAECMPALKSGNISFETREKLLYVSSLAGMCIAQSKTTLPHLLSYALSYHKKMPHGFACGATMVSFMTLYEDKAKVGRVLELLGFDSLAELGRFLAALYGAGAFKDVLTQAEANRFTAEVFGNKARLVTYPFHITETDVLKLYAPLVKVKQ